MVITEPPADLIQQEKIAEIITEFHVSEALNRQRKSLEIDSISIPEMSEIYGHLLNKYKVSKEQFYRSYEYYVAYPDKMGIIYKRVDSILVTLDPNPQKAKEKN